MMRPLTLSNKSTGERTVPHGQTSRCSSRSRTHLRWLHTSKYQRSPKMPPKLGLTWPRRNLVSIWIEVCPLRDSQNKAKSYSNILIRARALIKHSVWISRNTTPCSRKIGISTESLSILITSQKLRKPVKVSEMQRALTFSDPSGTIHCHINMVSLTKMYSIRKETSLSNGPSLMITLMELNQLLVALNKLSWRLDSLKPSKKS